MGLSKNVEDFWIAAAAAAPVIALAGLVAITDAAVAGDILRRKKKDIKTKTKTKTKKEKKEALKNFRDLVGGGRATLGPQNVWIIIYSILNLVAQGFVLIVALLALLHDGTLIPGTAIIYVEGIGLAVLLWAALLAAQVGRQRQRLAEAEKDDDAKKLAKYIADAQTAGPQQPAPQQPS